MTSRRGLGLVEAALAALLLAVAAAVLFQALGLSVRGTEQVADEMIATQIASDLIDWLSGVPFDALPEAREGPPSGVAFADASVAEAWRRKLDRAAIAAGYVPLVAVDALPGAAGPGRLKRILVSVRWSGAQGGGRTVKLARLRTDEVGL
jgi:hypothetical protein